MSSGSSEALLVKQSVMMPEDPPLPPGTSGVGMGLPAGQWSVGPNTGIVSLTDAALTKLLNPEPIDKWYILDPDPIARGQFAVVYHCRHRVTGEEFAAKFSSRWRLGQDCTADIVHEVAVCAMLRTTQRTVQLRDVFSTEAELILVMEFAAGGDLQTLLDEDIVPYERDVISFTKQLLEGLVFIHDRNIVHLDIKPQNLVLMGEFPDCNVKLCDFEISRVLTPGREVHEILGTPDYVAPEIILYDPITTKTDMWSLGVLTYVLLTGFLPFGGETDQETFLEISLGELDFPEELFEDISAEAIDFIKKLLIRKPQLRMSARECLEHAWMKADLSKAKIPPQPLCSSSTSSSVPTSSTAMTTTITSSTQGGAPLPFHSTVPVSSYQGPSVSSTASMYSPPSPALMSALSEMIDSSSSLSHLAKSSGSLSHTPLVTTPTNTTPTVLTPNNATPNVLTPMSSSPRDIGLPPVPPLTGQKSSTVNSNYSSTNSLYRGGSRLSLDRARSLSKSREVLFERMQMSNQRKTLSKSRDRLYDGHLGLSRSREDLWAVRSISHSEEGLSVFSWLNQDDSLYKSCNNVFLPMLPMLDENGMSGRLYKSLASIDKIDEVGTNANVNSDRQSIFDSRFSINDEDYNHLITRYNTAVNSHRNTPPRRMAGEGRSLNTRTEGRLRSPGKGGRGTSASDKRCSKHYRPAEAQLTQKIPKMSRAERMKRDAHRRRKGKKEKEKRTDKSQKAQQQISHHDNTTTEKPSGSGRAPSPTKRRGSVSHIEQRIQERHERQQEKLEKQERLEKNERRGSGGKSTAHNCRRRDSGEEKNIHKEKPKSNKNKTNDPIPNKPRSTSTKQLKGKNKSNSSDASPASSLESVKEFSSCKKMNSKNNHSTESKKSPRNSTSGASNIVPVQRERRTDMDEAYVSLDEPVDDGIFSRSESMDSTNTVESDHTVRATDTSSDTLESTMTSCYFNKDFETSQASDSTPVNLNTDTDEAEVSGERSNEKSEASEQEITSIIVTSCESMVELSAINEEEDKSDFARSVSTSSDIGSMLSENSEADKEDSSSTKAQDLEAIAANWRSRGRSMSMQPSDPPPFSHLNLCRSNSFNLVMPLSGFVASPWGDVCEGAISRALEMFKLKPSDMTSAGRNILERRSSVQSK